MCMYIHDTIILETNINEYTSFQNVIYTNFNI